MPAGADVGAAVFSDLIFNRPEITIMPLISIEFDRDTAQREAYSQRSRITGSKKLGILSSITLQADFISAIETGFGSPHYKHDDQLGYIAQNIQQNGQADLKSKGCDCIVAVGGTIVHNAINSSNLPFVSLVGAMPSAVGSNCCGGVSLESWASNQTRANILMSKLALNSTQNIALYRNNQSGMQNDEMNDWNSYAATIYNSTFNYNADFTGGLVANNTQGIVVSADPRFQNDKDLLVAAISAWLGTPHTNRYVIYPLQIYIESNAQQTAGKTTFYGPDLYQAYYKVGQLAQNSFNSNDAYVGFDVAPNLLLHI
jgi:hypothetical protein